MIYKATLTKSWRSHRGKLYPPGTTFKLVKRLLEVDSAIYDFVIPDECYGLIVLPNKIFKQLTDEEKKIKDSRAKAREEHLRATANPFISAAIVQER